MDIAEILPPLNSENLKLAIESIHEKRPAIAEGFIYAQTINMIAADPGTGKSTLATQLALELASGLPVFGYYKVIRPMKVLYIQTERSIIEVLERIEIMKKHYPINYDNLYVTDNYQGFNLIKEDQAKTFIQCILRDCPKADIIIIDPIYCMVAGGLKDDVPASHFTKVMNLLQKQTGAVLWYSHHTVKDSYSMDGKKIEKFDPFYGSQWLKAHVTGSYHLKLTQKGTRFELKKDNYKILPEMISLEYNDETMLSRLEIEDMPVIDKVNAYLNSMASLNKEFTFDDMHSAMHCSVRQLRTALTHSSIKTRLNVVNSYRNKHLYTAT